MKRNRVYILLFILMMVIILSLSWYLWIINLKLKQDIEKQETEIEILKNNHFNLEECILKIIEYDRMTISPNYMLKSEEGASVCINDLFENSPQKLIVRIPKESCLNCIMSLTHILQQELLEFDKQNIVYIVDYKTSKEIEYYKGILNIKNTFYIAHDFGLPIEKEDTPYVFLLDKDLVISHLFIPVYKQQKLSERYIQIIKEQLKNNI